MASGTLPSFVCNTIAPFSVKLVDAMTRAKALEDPTHRAVVVVFVDIEGFDEVRVGFCGVYQT